MKKKKIPLVRLKMVREKSLESYLDIPILSSNDTYDVLKELINDRDRECFVAMGLNNSNVPHYVEIVSVGTSNETLIGIKEVLKSAILTNSSKLFLAHNHPSGKLVPSEDDLRVTAKIKEAASLFDISILDHLIICENRYLSFVKEALL